jgi:hypothetical protein
MNCASLPFSVSADSEALTDLPCVAGLRAGGMAMNRSNPSGITWRGSW